MSGRGVFAGFGRTLGFAACVGLAAPIALALLRPLVGGGGALTVYAIGSTALYAAGLARGTTRGMAAAGVLLASGLALLLAGAGTYSTLLAMALLLGVVRSGWLCGGGRTSAGRDSFIRSFGVEAALVGGGLGLASVLASGSFFPISLALWGFFMTQSAFFLIGGRDAIRASPSDRAYDPSADAFDAVTRRAHGLLEDRPTA